jgi:RNA polymerase sigma-70 factor (ECF subfamily)
MSAGGRIHRFVTGVLSLRRPGGEVTPLDVARIHDTHADFVWRTLQRLGVRSADLEDALQEVFIVVHRRLHTFDATGRLSTWLFGICLRVAAAQRRRAHVRREQATSDGAECADESRSNDPEAMAAASEDRRRVEEALDGLPPERRVVFVMFEIEGMAAGEIAAELGVPVGTVYSRFSTARAEFVKAVERLGALAVPAAASAFFWLQHAALGAVLGAVVTTSVVVTRALLPEPPTPSAAAPLAARVPPLAREPVRGLAEAAKELRPELAPRPEEPSRPGAAPRSERAVATPVTPPGGPEEPSVVREARLLEQARSSLAPRPAFALERLAEHARDFPDGTLAVERELLAVDALVRLGRRTEAESRAAALRRRAPGSLYAERLEQILGRASEGRR